MDRMPFILSDLSSGYNHILVRQRGLLSSHLWAIAKLSLGRYSGAVAGTLHKQQSLGFCLSEHVSLSFLPNPTLQATEW
jgi:hypothetical protein